MGLLLFLIDIIVLGIIIFLKKIVKYKVAVNIILVLLAYFSLPFLGAGLIYLYAFRYPYEDIKYYSRVYTHFESDEICNILPRNLDDFEVVSFYYNPSLMMAGDRVILHVKTNSDVIDEYKNKYNDKAILVDELSTKRATKYGIYDVDEGFTYYILYSKPYRDNDYNHGEVVYIAISEDENEMIFFCDDW